MDLILSLPTSVVEADIQWLPNIAGEWHGIELHGTALDDDSLWSGLVDRLPLPVLHVHELLPTPVTRNLPEAPIATRNRLTDHLRRLLERAAAMSVRTATLDFGLTVDAGRRVDPTTVRGQRSGAQPRVNCALCASSTTAACVQCSDTTCGACKKTTCAMPISVVGYTLHISSSSSTALRCVGPHTAHAWRPAGYHCSC